MQRADPEVPVAMAAPLSDGQEALWFLHLMDPDEPSYNVSLTLRFAGGAAPAAVHAAVHAMRERHPVLRDVYRIGANGRPFQQTESAATASEVSFAVAGGPDETLRRVRDFVRIPFDLAARPPFRVLAVTEAGGSSVVSLVAHHIAMDGRSRTILARDFSAALRSFLDHGRANVPAPPPPAYAEFALLTSAPPSAAGLAYWTRQLAGSGPLPLAARPAPGVDRVALGPTSFALDRARTSELRTVALRRRSSVWAVSATVLAIALWRLTGREDIVFGSFLPGRRDTRFAGTVGHFVRTVVLRATVRGAMTPGEVLHQLQQVTTAAAEQQDVPFSSVVAGLRPRRDVDRNPLFNVALLHNPGVDTARASALPLGVSVVDERRADTRFDLEFTTGIENGCLAVAAGHRADRVPPGTPEALIGLAEAAVRSLLTDPDRRLDEPARTVP